MNGRRTGRAVETAPGGRLAPPRDLPAARGIRAGVTMLVEREARRMGTGPRGSMGDGRDGGAAYALGAARDAERRMRQVKAMVRLGAALRAEMGIERICAQVVEAVSGSTGFRVAAVNLTRAGSEFLDVVATTGLSQDNERELRAHPPRLAELGAGMQPRFRRSRSYFIPHQDSQVMEAAGGVVEPPAEPVTGAPTSGTWRMCC